MIGRRGGLRIGLVALITLGAVACRAPARESSSPPSPLYDFEDDSGKADGEAAGEERAPSELAALEAELGQAEAELRALEDPATAMGAEPSPPDDAARCRRICQLRASICELRERMCTLAAEHAGERRYEAACGRAEQACTEADDACQACG